jgi:hypothetical protein
MANLLNNPPVLFLLSIIGLWVAARIGSSLRKVRPLGENEHKDFELVTGATLTLLGLLIGFSFSMAISRYDQRKNYEEEEANAIGTEYVRADLLSGSSATTVHDLLKKYTEQRIRFYVTRDEDQLAAINADAAKLQNDMWSEVRTAAAAQPTPPIALVVSGMNDVFNSEGYTQAAWWNRIPFAAWMLMALIALSCNVLIGYSAFQPTALGSLVLPVAVALSFLLIADIDSPRGGLIRVKPQNLISLSQSLPTT